MNNTFLTAIWKDLVMVNYIIDPKFLIPFVPKGTSLDLYNDKCYISLVGFLFQNTKVLRIKVPFHNNFEEVNLRFYVKRYENNTWKRGVVFIKEIVPKPAISLVANTLYKEHYYTTKMNHYISSNKSSRKLGYGWKIKNEWQRIDVVTNLHPKTALPNTIESFITEHYYGYTKHHSKTYEYEVQHPSWELYKVLNYHINVDFALNYGEQFRILNHIKPATVLVAKGSNISVLNKRTIH